MSVSLDTNIANENFSIVKTSPHLELWLFFDKYIDSVYNPVTFRGELEKLVKHVSESDPLELKNKLEDVEKSLEHFRINPELIEQYKALADSINKQYPIHISGPFLYINNEIGLQIEFTLEENFCIVAGKKAEGLEIVKKYLELFLSDKLEDFKIEDGRVHAKWKA